MALSETAPFERISANRIYICMTILSSGRFILHACVCEVEHITQ